MKTYFAPGCGLLDESPENVQKILAFLKEKGLVDDLWTTCCKATTDQEEETLLINACSGCDRRWRTLYNNVRTVSLWEVLLENDYPFPDHSGMKVSVHDACQTRNQPQIQDALRECLDRMNIEVVEAELSRENARCCGRVYDKAGFEKDFSERMVRDRINDFPCEDIVVHCVGCESYFQLYTDKVHHLANLICE